MVCVCSSPVRACVLKLENLAIAASVQTILRQGVENVDEGQEEERQEAVAKYAESAI